MFFTFILLLVWLLLTDNNKKKGYLWNCKPEKTHKYVLKEEEKKRMERATEKPGSAVQLCCYVVGKN